jgi:hypothetical protein
MADLDQAQTPRRPPTRPTYHRKCARAKILTDPGGALVLGVLLIGVGLVHPSAAGVAIAVAGYLVLVGAFAAVLDARRRRGLRPAWSRLWRLLARSTTPERGEDSGPAGPA